MSAAHTIGWSNLFQERLGSLPSDTEALLSELHEVSCAYTDFCVALNERVEKLRRAKLPSAPTVSASSLPADILLLIFSILVEEEPLGDLCEWRGVRAGDLESDSDCSMEEDSHSFTLSCPYQCDCWLVHGLEWTRVTHVCAHWRRVSIENAMLWTNITLSLCTPWLHEVILRSRNLPLDITIPCEVYDWDAVEPVLSGCIHRIRSVSAERGSSIINTILSRSPAPMLETLDIDNNVANIHPFIMPADATEFLPQLRYLNAPVATFPLDVQFTTHSQLTHLAILSVTDAPSTAELCALLRAVDRVQFLQLENCLPIGPDDISAQTISLPHLETLILRGPTNACGAFLRSITYPHAAGVTLYMLPEDQPVLDSSVYLQRSGLGALLEVVRHAVFHSLLVSCVAISPNHWQLIVAAQRNPHPINDYVRDDTRIEQNWTGPSYEDLKIVCMLPPIVLHGNESSHVLALNLFAYFMETLLLASITTLSLKVDTLLLLAGDEDAWNCARWLLALRKADELKHIQLIARRWDLVGPNARPITRHEPCPYADLLLALSLGPHLSQKCILCPDLTEMTLVNIDAASTVVVGAGGGKFLRTTAARVLHYFESSRSYFERRNIHVLNTGLSWQRHFFGETDYGPLVKMGGEIVDMKEEIDQERVHEMINDAVLQSFPVDKLIP